MATLFRNVKSIVSCDDKDTIYTGVDVYCEDGFIREIGKDLDVGAREVYNCTGMIMYPGLINTHHHFYQIFSRNLPKAQNLQLFDWLIYMYEIWKNLDAEVINLSSKAAICGLLKSGCTTAFDHHYVFPKGHSMDFLDAQFSASDEMGIRMYASRGSMNLSKKDGGLPPDSVVQNIDTIMKDSVDVIGKYNDTARGSMHNIALAPCSPFSADSELYRQSAILARERGVMLHTHLCETLDEENYTLEKFGMRPLEYMESMGFIGKDTWYAHGIHFNDEELKVLRDTKTGICHCPTSNMKLSSGIARIPDMMRLGIKVGLGVDGSASNDGSNMLEEMRNAYLLSRIKWGDDSPQAYDFLKMATRGSASVLNRDDLGSIEIDKCADFFLIDGRRPELVGAFYDPKAMLCSVGFKNSVDMTVVAGKVVVSEKRIVNINEDELYEKAMKADNKYLKIDDK